MNKIFWLLILLSASDVSAEDSFDDILSLSLEELLQIKITGSTLTQENRQTVPAAVTVFTHEELKGMGLDYLDELANLVPGFQSYRAAGSAVESPISSRGRRISVVAAEILVMVDGQRVDGPRSSGMAIVLPKFSLKNIQRVEFIRGPGGAVYGSNAMMGIINIVTRSNINQLSLSYGSFNRQQMNLNYSQQDGDFQLDIFAQVDTDNGEDYQLADTFSSNQITTRDPRTLGDFSVKLSWKKTQLRLQHNQFSVQDFYELDGLSNSFNQRHGRLDAFSIKQSFDWQSINSWLQLDYKQSNVNLSTQFTAPGFLTQISTPSSSDALFVQADFDDYTESRLQWHNSATLDQDSVLQFGVEARYINAPQANTKNNFDLGDLANGLFPVRYYGDFVSTTPVQSQSKRNIFGLYAQYQRQLFVDTQLTLGARYDDFNKIGSQLSPRIGLVHQLNKQHSIKLLYGEAFRAPSESELNLQNNPVLLGNPDLDPETVKSWDLIWVGQWLDNAVSLGYFENHFSDAIIQMPTDVGIPRYENVGQGLTRGFELELSKQFNKNWLILANYTNIIDKPDISYREASQLASLIINYQQGNWNANLVATWYNQRELAATDLNNQRIPLDGNRLFYGKLSYDFKYDWQGYIQIKNLSDKQYNSPALGAFLTEGVANRGREILVGANWRF